MAFKNFLNVILVAIILSACASPYHLTAAEREPKNWQGYYERGWERLQAKDWTGALSDFDHVVKFNPEEYSAWLNRGVAKQNLGDLEGALKDYSRTIELRPNGYSGYFHRAQLNKIRGEYKAGLEDLNVGIPYVPKGSKHKEVLAKAYLERSRFKENLGNLDGAIVDWEKAVKLMPQWKQPLAPPGKPGIGSAFAWGRYNDLIKQGNLAEMRNILDAEPGLAKVQDNVGWSLLHYVTMGGSPEDLEMCKLLVDAGADVNAKGAQGNTPLTFSVYRMGGRESLSSEVYNGIIELLLKQGADPNSVNYIGATPLHLATVRGADPSAVELLLQYGANVNRVTVGGGAYTPLHAAVSAGRIDLVELLLANGADPDLRDGSGHTPLERARELKQREVEKVLKYHAKTPAGATGITVSEMDYVLKFRGFSIQQPTDDRWRLHSDNQEPHIASFYFAPLSPTHSFNATVQIRGVPADFATKQEFKEFVDTRLREHGSRFEELSFTSTLTELNGEWAVTYELRYLDKNPVNSSTPLFITIKGFMYLHPYWKKRVIDAFYSERGTEAELDGTLDPVGQELIDGTSPEMS